MRLIAGTVGALDADGASHQAESAIITASDRDHGNRFIAANSRSDWRRARSVTVLAS